MNRYAVEKVLWDIVSEPAKAAAFRDQPAEFLGSYRLGGAEADLLHRMDVKTLLALRINPMLVMRSFQMVQGRDQLPKYIRLLQEG
jgi:hypothetical protein